MRREWMDAHLPVWLLGIIDWFPYRLVEKCWAEDCPVASRRNLLHTPRQLHHCEGTPMAIKLTDPGWLYANGIDPRSSPEPVVPVSQVKSA